MRERVIIASSPERVADVCSPACRELLTERFEIVWNDGPELSLAQLTERLPGATVLLTSWGSPSLDEAALSAASDLKAIGHAAGSVKKLLPATTFDRDIAVFSAAGRIADSVAEYCLGAALTLLRRLPHFDTRVRSGAWKDPVNRGEELTGRHIGIIGASSTARAFLRLLAPFRVTAHVYDPYLSQERARELGVRKVSIEEALSQDIVSLHVPSTPETAGLIGARELAFVPDGGIIVNSARGAAIDQDAFFAEIGSGRIRAAIDVYDGEPPTVPDDIRSAPNVLLSPHIAGDTRQGHLALMEYVVRDIITWLDTGERGRSFVDPRAWATAA
ncbi:MAG TPA: hydroxyacid dehydrogenase [Mycobacteriales bacterium]|nr:hydroxyacid dehydrogenase [Mycobacteriales bacterium]